MNIEPPRQTKETKPRGSKRTPANIAAPTAVRTRRPAPLRDDLHVLITKRAYELYSERGYRHGCALDDWLDAEREILSRLPPV
jgi:hypothetical protein